MIDFESEDQQQQSNYPTETDTAFTPDEQEAIKEYKANLTKRINKHRSVLRGFESAFWGITSYSFAKFLILVSGSNALGFAVASVFVINNIVNRDCLDSFRLDRNDGEFQVEGMGKLLKFALSTVGTAFILWGSIGDFYHTYNNSNETYDNLNKTVEKFQELPQDDQNKWFIIGGVVAIAGLYVVVDSRGKR
jgi:hypothetical protein